MSRKVDRRPGRSDRVPLVRHLALCAAALAAFLLRVELGVNHEVLWIVAAAAVLNLVTSLCSDSPRLGPGVKVVSSAFGLAGWSALAALTGGLASPFLSGLWLEIVLSGSGGSSTGILLTTAGAIAGLWAQHLLHPEETTTASLLMTGFLLVVGGLTLHMAGRWRRSRSRMTRRIVTLRRRLSRIETELGQARALGGLEEDAARLAHGLKNAVHSMRGFVGLLQPQLTASARCNTLLDGLRSAIDQLEETARATLGPAGPRRRGGWQEMEALTPGAIREVVDQVAAAFPEVKWSLALDGIPAGASAPARAFREALGNVLRNAAEAMQGRGDVLVEAVPGGSRLEIRVRDRGPGFRPEMSRQTFKPGCTTKEGGHGLGLFLARRLLEAGGGHLFLSSADGGGVLCSMELPLVRPSGDLTRAI